ncbi:unnamed protein product [Paramecium pentaurelia]|uniref:Uncharacterized protein n=1 Tax=Paramecium pentaurelia TaxID=43138 RepID=A0A8S1U503_9CILI|nr:unnamed protein product [Paramecium pentaurelia]
MKIIMKEINSFLMESIWKDKRLTSGIQYKRGDKLMEDIIIKQEKKEGNWIELHNNFNEYKYIQNVEIIKQLSQENKKMETELNNGILNLKEKKLVVDDTLSKEIRMEYGKNYITIILIIQLVIMNRDNVTFLIGQYNNAKKCNQWKILFKSEKESQQEIIKGNHNENQIKIDEQIDLHQIMDKLFIRVYIEIGRKIKNGILRIEMRHQSLQQLVEDYMIQKEGKMNNGQNQILISLFI